MEQNEKDRLQYMIDVMQAYKDGKEIEVTDVFLKKNCWESVSNPSWDWSESDYRIKPEPPKPKYRPFESAEEVMEAIKEHGVWVIWNGNNAWRHQILSFSGRMIRTSDVDVEMDKVLRDYTFADGTPFGKLIEK